MSAGGAVRLPPGAVDTHVHVFDPVRFPYAAQAGYRPGPHETSTADQLRALLDAQGMDGVVIVDPTSGYDGDPACLLHALEVLGPRARGILRWSPRRAPFAAPQLAQLRTRGIAGVRVDCVADGVERLRSPEFGALAATLAGLDLVLDVQCEGAQLAPVTAVLADVPARCVIDHLGRPDVSRGVDDPGFRSLLALVGRGGATVKLSGPMRMAATHGWHDVDPFVSALRAANPGALVWGSDWPFLRAQSRIDYAPLLTLLERWIPDEGERRHVLADTPRRVFFD